MLFCKSEYELYVVRRGNDILTVGLGNDEIYLRDTNLLLIFTTRE